MRSLIYSVPWNEGQARIVVIDVCRSDWLFAAQCIGGPLVFDSNICSVRLGNYRAMLHGLFTWAQSLSSCPFVGTNHGIIFVAFGTCILYWSNCLLHFLELEIMVEGNE